MSYRRALIRTFDRPGGRALAAAVINRLPRRHASAVRVYFRNGMWKHQEKDVTFVDSSTLDYHSSIFPTWANGLERVTANAIDSWFHVYKPHPRDFIVDAGAGKARTRSFFPGRWDPRGKCSPSRRIPSRSAVCAYFVS
jgi:hypothetical protein